MAFYGKADDLKGGQVQVADLGSPPTGQVEIRCSDWPILDLEGAIAIRDALTRFIEAAAKLEKS